MLCYLSIDRQDNTRVKASRGVKNSVISVIVNYYPLLHIDMHHHLCPQYFTTPQIPYLLGSIKFRNPKAIISYEPGTRERICYLRAQ